MTTQHKRFGSTLARIGGILLLGLLAGVPLVKAQCPLQMPATIPFFLPIPAQSGQPSQPGQQCLVPNPDGNGSYWFSLSFNQTSGVVPFGLYTYNGSGWIFHLDLGWEYLVDGTSTCTGCAYFYDFTSTHWFFTSPYLFPYMSDLTLGHILWYVPDVTQPGQYTSNPRFFYDFSTNQVISLGSASSAPNYSLPQVPTNALSINGTVVGTSPVNLAAGTQQSFAFTYTDPTLGATGVAWGQVMLLDSTDASNCYLKWGTNIIDLYDGTPQTQFANVPMSDSFCSVSPASVAYSSSAVATIPVTFYQASSSPYSVLTQAYDVYNNYGPWEQVGSVMLTPLEASENGSPVYQAPPESAPVPTPPAPVQKSGMDCTDISGNWTDSNSGSWTYSITTSGGLVTSGSTATYWDLCHGSANWEITGGRQPDGTWQVAFINGTPGLCNGYLVDGTATITPGCGTASVLAVLDYSLPIAEYRPAAVAVPSYTSWVSSNQPITAVTWDLMGGTVNTQLSGHKTSDLTISVNNAQGQAMLVILHQSASAGNFFNDTKFRANLPVGQYSSVTATWDEFSVTIPVSFYMLGLTHFTQYNTPYHSQCANDPEFVLVINKIDSQNCYYQDVMLAADFAGSVYQNGTGVNDLGGTSAVLKSYAAGAKNVCYLYPGYDSHHTFFSVDSGGNLLTKIIGAHWGSTASVVLSDGTGPGSGSALNNSNPQPGSVATAPDVSNNPPGSLYQWGDSILLFDQSDTNDSLKPRSVQDLCPACTGQGTQQSNTSLAHIDLYNGASQSCSGHSVPDYGTGQYYAIRLLR